MTLYQRFCFFKEHAGWRTPPGRAVCALALARAEIWAEEEDVEFEWSPDDQDWHGDTPAPKEVLICGAIHPDGESAYLCGIGDPDHNYRRVVEAELASELQEHIFAELARSIRQL